MSSRRVAVIGAGVAGLTAARELARRGIDVTVLEASERPGGAIRSEREAGFLHEHAANGFLSGDPEGAVPLCRELGVELAEASAAATRRWVFVNGALREVPTSPGALVSTDLLSWRGKLALLGEPLRPRQTGQDESVAAFARRRLGPEAERALVAPMVTGVFAGDADRLSLRAAFPAIAALEEQGGLARGLAARAIARVRERGRAGRPARAGRSRLCAPVEGAEALPRALAAELGARVRTGARVDDLRPDGDGLSLRLASGERARFDAAVVAIPAYAAARVLTGASPELARELDGIGYAPIAIAQLGYRREDVRHPLDGFGFLVAAGEAPRVLGAVFESVLFPGRAPDGRVLVRALFGGARDPDAARLPDDDLVSRARADLGRAIGLDAKPVHARVVRRERAIPQYALGHADRVARAEALAAPLGITLAGNPYRAVAVNKLVGDARRVASDVAGRLAGAAALVLAVMVAVTALACSGGQRSARSADDGGESAAGAAGDYAVAVTGDGGVADGGRVEVRATWLSPPPPLVRANGRNACGALRRPPLDVHTMGGVRGAVVALTGIQEGRAPPAAEPVVVAVNACAAGPAVAVAPRAGAPIDVVNRDERRHEVAVAYLGALGGEPVSPDEVARATMPLVGGRYRVKADRIGVYRARAAADPEQAAFVIVPPHPYVAATDSRGRAVFDDVPAGSYEIVVWHRPLEPGADPIAVSAPVTARAGEKTSVSVPLAPGRGARTGGGGDGGA